MENRIHKQNLKETNINKSLHESLPSCRHPRKDKQRMRDDVGVFSQQWEGDVASGHSGRPEKGCPFWGGASEPGETIYPNPT